MDPDVVLRPWLDALADSLGGPLALFDAHTHVGANDPDGYRQTPAELIAHLDAAGARAAVFPMHEPAGYPAANDAALAAARAAGDRLVSYCRVDPRADAVAEATRMLDLGARGIKLHPRAERFTMGEPAVRGIVALAHERRVPVLIHAGRGIPALGRDTVALASAFPGATLILAHAAISDLAWLWRVLPEHPNVLIDTAWWNPIDLVALFTLVPPASVVWASDSPYGAPVASAVIALRCALQAGLSAEQVRWIAGARMLRALEGGAAPDLGPALGPQAARAVDPVYERVATALVAAMSRLFVRADPAEGVALARLACAVGEGTEHAPLCAQVLELIDLYEEHLAPPPDGRPLPVSGRYLIVALALARTPAVALPARPAAPAPVRRAE
jgi:predicted TIM-barrel fold metal-dependent hydrolase